MISQKYADITQSSGLFVGFSRWGQGRMRREGQPRQRYNGFRAGLERDCRDEELCITIVRAHPLPQQNKGGITLSFERLLGY